MNERAVGSARARAKSAADGCGAETAAPAVRAQPFSVSDPRSGRLYGSIHGFTGPAMQPILESGAGRFTDGYWDNLDAYLRNSPAARGRRIPAVTVGDQNLGSRSD